MPTDPSRRIVLRSLAGAGVLALGLTACSDLDDPDGAGAANPGDGTAPTQQPGGPGARRFGAE
ncbi:hypothetical protein AB0O00_34835, partial [Kitasatospora sp. NPDC093558]